MSEMVCARAGCNNDEFRIDGYCSAYCRDVGELEAELTRLREALEFYADPQTYHAIAFLPDPPAGAFMDDFTHDEDYGRPMPGARARAALTQENPDE